MVKLITKHEDNDKRPRVSIGDVLEDSEKGLGVIDNIFVAGIKQAFVIWEDGGSSLVDLDEIKQ